MKHIPGKSVTKRMTAEEAAILARQDKRKLIILTLGLAVLVAAFVVSTMSANRKKAEEDARLLGGVANQSGPLTTEVFVPDFPDRAILDAVADKTESEQVILNEPAVLAVLKYTQKLTPMQLDQLGMRNLTAEDIQAIASDPAQHRLDARRARGRVLQVRAKAGTDAAPGTIQGTMETTDGLRLHFVVGDAGKDELPNDVLRLDGFFVQMYKTEAQREWITAPLFVGRRLIPSYAPLVLDENLDTPALAKVTDDQIGDVTGIPEEAKWELMAKAIQGKDRIDWAQAPEINDEYIGRMLAGDPSLRGQPFRIPVRINADSRTVRAGENPLMRDTFMEGWIGDYTSKKGNGLIHWTGAF
ncbi:MAG TPA: hypothetical protein PLJ12_09265, partial [Planctomycetota bacterium]|nr:hypothetical protein [Planctomycetota bacterium]